MFARSYWLSCLLAASAYSASTTSSGSQSLSLVTSIAASLTSFTGTYDTDTSQSTVSTNDVVVLDGTVTTTSSASKTTSASSVTTTSKGTTSIATLLEGGGVGLVTLSIINGTTTVYPSTTASATKTATSSSTSAVNTQACNNYPEFCDRKYSNITEVCAHNSAFSVSGNAASNQALSITDMLDDGIRMIQGETHWVNDTVYNCHTSCDLLNVGPYVDELKKVAAWVESHPYDVVTILIVNSDYTEVTNYVDPIQNSGLGPYLYTPAYVPQHLDQWPTLSEMILSGKRVVVFMDYDANQTEVPYILDEFTHMWETPFSPTNQSFPCTVQRPPTLTNLTNAKDNYMYLANHNLNQDFTLLGESILLPNTAELNLTNSANLTYGSLGTMAETCYDDWDRAPNFLLVDYYNVGSGSVFDVAAKYNNVTYNRACCGTAADSAAVSIRSSSVAVLLAVVASIAFLL